MYSEREGIHPSTAAAKKLNVDQSPVVRVIGKAFWDIGHAPKD